MNVLVLCQRKFSKVDKQVKKYNEAIHQYLDNIYPDIPKKYIHMTPGVGQDKKNQFADYQMPFTLSDPFIHTWIKQHFEYFDIIIGNTCPQAFNQMDIYGLYQILKPNGIYLDIVVDLKGNHEHTYENLFLDMDIDPDDILNIRHTILSFFKLDYINNISVLRKISPLKLNMFVPIIFWYCDIIDKIDNNSSVLLGSAFPDKINNTIKSMCQDCCKKKNGDVELAQKILESLE